MPIGDPTQVLHQVGGWPAGLWQRVDDGAEAYGELLQVRMLRGYQIETPHEAGSGRPTPGETVCHGGTVNIEPYGTCLWRIVRLDNTANPLAAQHMCDS